MYNSSKKNWFEGASEANSSLETVKDALENKGEFFEGIIRRVSGITNVELQEAGNDFVTIKTNEGLMKRTNIKTIIESDKIILEFDEEYAAGKVLTTNSHYKYEYQKSENKVKHHLTISNLKAPGFAGFFYRNFGSSNMGKDFLRAHKEYLEEQQVRSLKNNS